MGKIKSLLNEIQNYRGSVPKGRLSKTFLEAYKVLGFAFPTERVCVVGGTNGKGSVVHCLSELLQAHGLIVGKFISPHLVELGERIQVNGENIESQRLEENLIDIDDSLSRNSKLSLKDLSFFELLLLSALKHFEKSGVEFLVLEIGVGGGNDPVGQIPHDFNILTSLSFDHKEILGESLEEIFAHKIGMIKKEGVLVHGLEQKFFESLNTPEIVSDCLICPVNNPEIQYKKSNQTLFTYNEDVIRTGYFGPIGAKNTLISLTMFDQIANCLQFEVDRKKLVESIENLVWPGRMQKLDWFGKGQLWLSGDHNVEGWQALRANLKLIHPEKIHLFFGLGPSKDLSEFTKTFDSLPVQSVNVVAGAYNNRAIEDYPDKLTGKELNRYQNFSDVDWAGLDVNKYEDLILICGSLYFVGHFLKYFRESSLKIRK